MIRSKTLIVSGLFVGLSGALADIDVLPSKRETVEVLESDRNPFGLARSPEEPQTIAQAESEESRLRRLLSSAKVAGISGSDENPSALLGSVVLRPGATLPPFFRNQSEKLRVKSVASTEIVLEFVEVRSEIQPREIRIPVALKPRVDQLLVGEIFEKLVTPEVVGPNAAGLTLPAVEDSLRGSREVSLQNLVERRRELMGTISSDAQATPTP